MKIFFVVCIRRFRRSMVSKNRNRGAIAVEYALGMGLAAMFMVGVELMFRGMARNIIQAFIQMVIQFPDI